MVQVLGLSTCKSCSKIDFCCYSMVHFAVVILTPLKGFFLLWIWIVTISPRPDLKDINGLRVFKETFMMFVGGDNDH